MKPTSSKKRLIRLGAIHIIESLPTGDLRTGERLRDLVEPLALVSEPHIDVCPWREPTRESFLHRLHEIYQYTLRVRRAPLLHLEMHGTPHGLELASGEQVSWAEMKEPLTAINVACRLNLFVVLGACDGEGLLHIVQLVDRAPVWALIGPKRQVEAGEIDDANQAFYRTYLTTRDGGLAWRAMNDSVKRGDRPFRLYTAELMFRWVMGGYFEEYCSDARLTERAQRITEQILADGAPAAKREQVEDAVIGFLRDHHSHFEQTKSHFFFTDVCPENAERFPIQFEDVSQGPSSPKE